MLCGCGEIRDICDNVKAQEARKDVGKEGGAFKKPQTRG